MFLKYKFIKKALKITLWTLTVIILLLAALLFSLQFKPVQSAIAKKAANYLSKELNTKISIESLYIKPFKSVVLEGLYVQDLDKDTLLHSPRFTVDMNYFSIKQRIVSVESVQMDNGKLFLKRYKSGKTNLQFILDYFSPPTTTPTAPQKKFELSFDKVVLNNIDFKYKNLKRQNKLKTINFDDLHLRNFYTTILNIGMTDHLFKGDVKRLSFREKSGFYLENLKTLAIIDSNQMEFKNLFLKTPRSQVSDYLILKYSKIADLSQFVKKVYLKGNFQNALIHTKDIAFFAPGLAKINLDVRVKGMVSGYVNDLKARNLTASAGQATYLKGNFDIKGLPSVDKAVVNLRFDQLHTNKKDLDRIILLTTGKKGVVPVIAAKFGDVNFKGNFSGLLKDFKADGEIKTALGRIRADLRMSLNGVARYSGVLHAYDFNLAKLLDRKDLGRTTLTARIGGQGFKIKELRENIDADVKYFDFKGYRYTNIDIKGKYNRSNFTGNIDVNDRNIKLNFLGGIDFTPALPVFNFNAEIRNTNLHKLGFTKDTIQVDADFQTAFSGDNLNNIQGNMQLRRIRMTTPERSLVVDSVYLVANGLGSDRSLSIHSDILDAGITGQYDLNHLPNYFTSVLKQYIPSLKSNGGVRGKQNFSFTLNLKYFEPVSLMFIPALKIPEGARFQGRFISAENVATLIGSSPLIEYNKIKVNNLIIDEATTPTALNLFITSDRVDITDNLYIKNVNMANIFRNDSLSLNIKLSDKDAVNQLDLNGLVEFDTENFASLSILPSDVIINNDVWRVPEQVRLNFDKGKLAIRDFELSRDNQILTLDGVISADPDDKLNAGFKNFKLRTFNPLTSTRGVLLDGELNGNVMLSSVTKTPNIESDLVIDSLVMNNIAIGELTMVANLDNSTKLVDMVLNIQKDGMETMNVAGSYNANSDQNTLNLDLEMNNSELVIFQPFLKSLVSNITGNISADLKVTGRVFDPQINGTAKLINAGMVVNYLKTPYKISDEVRVTNSIVELDNLELSDIKNNKARARGTINFQNPKNPLIDISVRARNFMALNTTSKDNPVYFGTAYGTGTFTFKGPTNSMQIVIDAKTEEGTVFNIPLNSTQRVASNDFITFVAKDSTLAPQKQASFNGLEMTLNLEVDEASQVNIITDLGKLSGRGTSEALSMNITSLGDFQMFGSYLISSGEFQYTAQEYISKIFEIRQGGSIRWTGDPEEAEINLTAIYSRRANIANLYRAAGLSSAENNSVSVVAEARMTLTGSLTRPDIRLGINFPQDPYIEDILQSYFSDVNNRTQQALSFIARQSFAPNTGLNVQAASSTVVNTITELTFNQLNNILAQTLNLRSFDLNVRSLNDASASVRLFNNRLILTGGITDTRAEVSGFDVIGNNIASDVEAQYLIKKDGSLIARASNRLNNRVMLNTNQEYVSALGLVYRKDFDTLGEFLRALIGQQRREERQNGPRRSNPATPLPTNTSPTTTPTAESNSQKNPPED